VRELAMWMLSESQHALQPAVLFPGTFFGTNGTSLYKVTHTYSGPGPVLK